MTGCEIECYCPNCDRGFNRKKLEAELAEAHAAIEAAQVQLSEAGFEPGGDGGLRMGILRATETVERLRAELARAKRIEQKAREYRRLGTAEFEASREALDAELASSDGEK